MSTKNIPTIIKGGDFKLSLRLTKDGNPEPLDTPSEIAVYLPAQDTSVNSIAFTLTGGKVTITSDERGEFDVEGDEADSPLLNSKAAAQDITVKIVRGTEDIVRNIRNAVIIEETALQAP